jgi:hypothetical protein
MKTTWIYGLSIYPVSYLLTVIFKMISGERILFGTYGSIVEWAIIFFSQWILDQFFGGISLAQPGLIMSTMFFIMHIVLVVLINASIFVLITRFLPMKWKPVSIVILYVMFLSFNCYIPDIGF